METLTRPPQTPVHPRAIADRPRRWPRRVIFVLVALASIIAATSVVWASRYQPLVGGGTGPRSVRPARLEVRSYSANGYRDGSFSQIQMRLVPGTTYRIGFPMWNAGPLPVMITGLGPSSSGERGDAVRQELVGTTPMTAGRLGTVQTAFEPFTLHAGEGVEIFVDVRIDASALGAGTRAIVNNVELAYSTFGFLRHETGVFLGMAVEFCKPPDCGSS